MLNSEARNGGNEPPKESTINEKTGFALYGKVIKCGRLRVRETASEDAKVITEIPVGTSLKVHEIESAEFVHVQLKSGMTGYCMSKLIEVSSPDKK